MPLFSAAGYYAPNGAYRDAAGFEPKISGPHNVQANVPQVQNLPQGVAVYQAAPYQTYQPTYTEATPVTESAQVEDRDGSLFPGGPCKNCSKDGSLFPGGPCKSCSKDGSLFPGPCKKCEERRIEYVSSSAIQNYVMYTPVVYEAMHRDCCAMAPLALDHVDFRIKNTGIDGPYSSHVGNYRFRIFGCRRFNKEANFKSFVCGFNIYYILWSLIDIKLFNIFQICSRRTRLF